MSWIQPPPQGHPYSSSDPHLNPTGSHALPSIHPISFSHPIGRALRRRWMTDQNDPETDKQADSGPFHRPLSDQHHRDPRWLLGTRVAGRHLLQGRKATDPALPPTDASVPVPHLSRHPHEIRQSPLDGEAWLRVMFCDLPVPPLPAAASATQLRSRMCFQNNPL